MSKNQDKWVGKWRHGTVNCSLWLFPNGEVWGAIDGEEKVTSYGKETNYVDFLAWAKDRGHVPEGPIPESYTFDPGWHRTTAEYKFTAEGIAEQALRVDNLARIAYADCPPEELATHQKWQGQAAKSQDRIKQIKERHAAVKQQLGIIPTPTGDEMKSGKNKHGHVVINGVCVQEKASKFIELFKRLGRELSFHDAMEECSKRGLGRLSDMTFIKYMRIAYGKDCKTTGSSWNRRNTRPTTKTIQKRLDKVMDKPKVTHSYVELDDPNKEESRPTTSHPCHPGLDAIALLKEANTLAAKCGGRGMLRELLDQLDQLSGVITRD